MQKSSTKRGARNKIFQGAASSPLLLPQLRYEVIVAHA